MTTIRKAVFSVILSGIAMSYTAPAFAVENGLKNKAQTDQPAPDYSLPGVKAAKPIVSPAQPEPDNATTNTNPDGSFNIGNTRVKISGDITVDIGTGNSPNGSNK